MRSHLACALLLLAAAPASAMAQAAPDAPIEYSVRPGDSLYSLAQRYLRRLEDYAIVQKLNRIADPYRIPVGMRLHVPLPLLRTAPIDARVVAFRGDVTIAGTAAALTLGTIVREGARVATGANSFVTLALPDGSTITFPSQTQVQVERLRRILLTGTVDRSFLIEGGRSQSRVTPARDARDRFIVRTPVAVAAVRGTDFRVDYEPEDGSATAEVIEGSVGVGASGGDEAKAVNAAFGLKATRNGVGEPVPLLPAPNILQAGQAQTGAMVTLDAAPIAGAESYRFQLASDAAFHDLQAEVTNEAPHAAFENIEDGAYFVRATAIDANGLEGLPAVASFERQYIPIEMSAVPMAGGRHHFRWHLAGPGSWSFRFQLRRAEETRAMIDQPGLKGPSFIVTSLPAGIYQWRVVASRIDGGRSIEHSGAWQELRVQPENVSAAP